MSICDTHKPLNYFFKAGKLSKVNRFPSINCSRLFFAALKETIRIIKFRKRRAYAEKLSKHEVNKENALQLKIVVPKIIGR